MIERLKVVVLSAALVALLPAGMVLARWSSVVRVPPTSSAPTPARSTGKLDPQVASSLAASISDRAPFRRSRRPAEASYDPGLHEPTGSEAEPRAPRPTIVLAGVALGGQSLAVLEGIPGKEGPTVMAEGDTAAGLRVRRIRRTGVVVTGYDTSWMLPIKEPWR